MNHRDRIGVERAIGCAPTDNIDGRSDTRRRAARIDDRSRVQTNVPVSVRSDLHLHVEAPEIADRSMRAVRRVEAIACNDVVE